MRGKAWDGGQRTHEMTWENGNDWEGHHCGRRKTQATMNTVWGSPVPWVPTQVALALVPCLNHRDAQLRSPSRSLCSYCSSSFPAVQSRMASWLSSPGMGISFSCHFSTCDGKPPPRLLKKLFLACSRPRYEERADWLGKLLNWSYHVSPRTPQKDRGLQGRTPGEHQIRVPRRSLLP